MSSEVIDTLAHLVAMPTVSHRPLTALASYLAERAEQSGFRVHRFETSPGKMSCTSAPSPPDGEPSCALDACALLKFGHSRRTCCASSLMVTSWKSLARW